MGNATENLFVRAIGRLSVGRKLMLIYLLDLTAVIYVSSILINEKFIGIDFARKEIAGNAYVVGVRDSLIDTALLGTAGATPRLVATTAVLAQTERSFGTGMQSAELNTALSAALERLALAAAAEKEAAQSAALATGRELLTRVGNQSNLILDPDLDSYYTMSLIVLRYPELLEMVNRIGQQLRSQAGVEHSAADARTQYLIFEGKLDATIQGIQADHAEAFAAGGKGLKTALQPAQDQLQGAVDGFRQQARLVIETGGSPQAMASAWQTHATLIRALESAWDTGSEALDVMLHKRVRNLFQRMWMHLAQR